MASENFGECLVLNLDLVDLRRGKLLELRPSLAPMIVCSRKFQVVN